MFVHFQRVDLELRGSEYSLQGWVYGLRQIHKELLNYSGSSQLITQQSSTTQPNFEIGGLVGNIYGLTIDQAIQWN
ncbi:Hypothetical protein J6899_02796 [Nakaseomyces glabratus]